MLIEITEGFWAEPELVAVVKATGDEECAVFTAGQSAIDGGFKLNYPAGEVAQALNDALETPYMPDEDGEEEADGSPESGLGEGAA